MSFLDQLNKAPEVKKPRSKPRRAHRRTRPEGVPAKPKMVLSTPKPAKISQKKKAELGEYNGSTPLKIRRHEECVQHYVNHGLTPTEAYRATTKVAINPLSASKAASRLFGRADVRARVAFLQLSKPSAVQSESDPGPDRMVTLEEIALQLSRVVRIGGSDSAFISACTNAAKLISEMAKKDDTKLEPTELVSHLRRFAGWDSEQILKETGGLLFLLRRFAQVLKVGRDELQRALDEWEIAPPQVLNSPNPLQRNEISPPA